MYATSQFADAAVVTVTSMAPFRGLTDGQAVSQPPVFGLNEAIAQSVPRLVDDAGATREPSHSDIEAAISRAKLDNANPHNDPTERVGKQKRARHILTWAIDNDHAPGTAFVEALIATERDRGGFRRGSLNYCGQDAIHTSSLLDRGRRSNER